MFGVLGLAAKNAQNAAYISIPLSDGSDAVFQILGTAGAVVAAKLKRELMPLGIEVTAD